MNGIRVRKGSYTDNHFKKTDAIINGSIRIQLKENIRSLFLKCNIESYIKDLMKNNISYLVVGDIEGLTEVLDSVKSQVVTEWLLDHSVTLNQLIRLVK